ncbi:MAG: hypothetical protein NT154_07485 [Verrucomicrobia bacterium]|nr:hypothetical protein [Verrucomicrobiota bacterium]
MKRYQNRAVTKSSRHSAAEQSKTNTRRDKTRTRRRAAGIVTCVFFDRADGIESFRVDFSHNEFACIERAIKDMGITLERFFNDVLLKSISSREGRATA